MVLLTMRTRLRLQRAALVLCLFLPLALWWAASARRQTAAASAEKTPVSLTEDRAPIGAALAELFRQARIPYTLDPDVRGVVTVRVDRTPFFIALRELLKASDTPVACSVGNGVYRISRRPPRASAPTPPPSAVLGTISGRVTRDGGLPAAGFTVRAVPAAFPRYSQNNPNMAVTDADGRYTLALHPPGIFAYSGPMNSGAKGYLVWVSNGGQPYVEPPPRTVDTAPLPGHTASGVGFVLRLGPQITVHAHDAITGAPVPGLTVRAGTIISMSQTPGVTGPDGTLRFRVPFTDVRLEAEVPDAEQRTTQAAPGYGAGGRFYRQVTAAPGQEIDWEIKTYGTSRDSDWHGVVLEPDGPPPTSPSESCGSTTAPV